MNRGIVPLLALVCVATGGATSVRGQSTQPVQSTPPASTQQTSTQQGTSSQASSAGSSQTSAPSSSQSSSQSSAQAGGKKVWTNDDVGDLRDRAPISTIGNANPKPTKAAVKQAPPPKKDPKWYLDQIHGLQAKLPPLDDKIQQLQAALNGDQVNPTRQFGGVRPDDWRDQLQRLQKEREDIEAKISALEDQARHDGVAPNLLPQQ